MSLEAEVRWQQQQLDRPHDHALAGSSGVNMKASTTETPPPTVLNPKQSKKFVVDAYLKKQLTQMKKTYSKYGGPQDAQAKKKIGSITAQVQDNSPFGDPFLPWSKNTTSNRTRKINNKTSIIHNIIKSYIIYHKFIQHLSVFFHVLSATANEGAGPKSYIFVSGFSHNIKMLVHKWTPGHIYPSRYDIKLYVCRLGLRGNVLTEA